MEVVIAGVIGAIGTAVGVIIKAAFSRNQNAKDQQTHEERLLEIGLGVDNMRNEINKSLESFKDEFKTTVDSFAARLDKVDKKLDSFAAEQKGINVVSLRHSIVQTYNFYKDKKEVPNTIYQSTLNLFDQYKTIGGNSFVQELIDEMNGWNKI